MDWAVSAAPLPENVMGIEEIKARLDADENYLTHMDKKVSEYDKTTSKSWESLGVSKRDRVEIEQTTDRRRLLELCKQLHEDRAELIRMVEELEEKYHAESNMRAALNLATEQLQARVSALQSQVDRAIHATTDKSDAYGIYAKGWNAALDHVDAVIKGDGKS